MKNLLFFVALFLACSPKYQVELVRGRYPYPVDVVQGAESDAARWAKLVARYKPQAERELGFLTAPLLFQRAGVHGEDFVFRYFAPAVESYLRKEHPLYAGALFELVVRRDTPRALYYREVPWE